MPHLQHCLFGLSLLFAKTALAYTNIYIGGLFNAFDADKTVNRAGSHLLHAYRMAINEINSKSDGVEDALLPNHQFQYTVKPSHGFLESVTNSATLGINHIGSAGAGTKILAVIGGLSDKDTISSTDMLAVDKTIQMSCTATSAELSNGRDYPYKLRTTASESFVGKAYQHVLLEDFKYRRIAIFSTAEYFSAQSLFSLLDEEVGVFEVLSKQVLEPGYLNFKKEIHAVKATGARVFVLLTDAQTTAALMVQGRRSGLFDEGSIIFGHNDAVVDETLANIIKFDPNEKVEDVMHGFMGLKYTPGHAVGDSTERGKAFMTRWRAQAPTKALFTGYSSSTTLTVSSTSFGAVANGMVVWQSGTLFSTPITLSGCTISSGAGSCSLSPPLTLGSASSLESFVACSTAADGPGNYLFVRSDSKECAGLDFSQFPTNGTTLDENVGNAYDAVYAIAHAMDYLITEKSLGVTGITSDLLMDASINHTKFDGLTNAVSFSNCQLVEGGCSEEMFGRGDRESGLRYDFYNYNHEVGWIDVGRWDEDGNFQLCDERLLIDRIGPDEPCTHSVIYHTKDKLRPRDRYPDIILEISPALRGLFVAIGALGMLLVTGISLFLLAHRNHKIIKAAQPPMLVMVLLGEFIGSVRILIASMPLHDSTWECVSNVWMGHLAFGLVFMGLFLKMWRVDKIINGKSLKRVKISNRDITLLGVAAIAILCALLVIISAVGRPYTSLAISTKQNVDTYIYECHEKVPETEDALYGIEAFFILWGISLCNSTKDAPSAVNESKPIAYSTAIIIGLGGIIMPVAYLLEINPVAVEIMVAFGFTVGVFSTTAILFTPKVLSLYSGVELDKGMELRNAKSSIDAAKIYDETSVSETALLASCRKALHALDLDGKFGLCQRQIEYWRGMMMTVEEKRSSATSSGTMASEAYGARSSIAVVDKNDSDDVETEDNRFLAGGIPTVTATSTESISSE